MAKKKEKPVMEGAPEYMVTYGDMMTLLLCFFVILLSMSEMKQDQKFQKVMESLKRAFGYAGGVGHVPGITSPTNTMDTHKTQLILKKAQLREGKSKDQGIEGENPSVTKIREGLEHTYGGIVKFEAGRARLLEAYRGELDKFVEQIKGLNSRIRIRGHATAKQASQYVPFPTLADLSYARARAVKQYLVEQGIRPERMTVEACGANEPVRVQAYDDKSQAANRRVSIVVTETLVPDFRGKPPDEAEDTIR